MFHISGIKLVIFEHFSKQYPKSVAFLQLSNKSNGTSFKDLHPEKHEPKLVILGQYLNNILDIFCNFEETKNPSYEKASSTLLAFFANINFGVDIIFSSLKI